MSLSCQRRIEGTYSVFRSMVHVQESPTYRSARRVSPPMLTYAVSSTSLRSNQPRAVYLAAAVWLVSSSKQMPIFLMNVLLGKNEYAERKVIAFMTIAERLQSECEERHEIK